MHFLALKDKNRDFFAIFYVYSGYGTPDFESTRKMEKLRIEKATDFGRGQTGRQNLGGAGIRQAAVQGVRLFQL